MMNKRLMSLVAVICLIVIVALISSITFNDSSPPQEETVQTVQSATSFETQTALATGSNDVPKVEAVATSETTFSTAPVELPRPENQLAKDDYRWSQILRRDSIKPIYEPRFVSAEEADYSDTELVIGVAIQGEAKAYAIGPLNGREMVNDTVGGVPVLVTW